MYSSYVSFVLGGMVVTGAARSIVAKLFYQFGFEHPLFLTLLYLSGQALSLVPYNAWRLLVGGRADGDDEEEEKEKEAVDENLALSERLTRSARRSSVRLARAVFTTEPDKEAPATIDEDDEVTHWDLTRSDLFRRERFKSRYISERALDAEAVVGNDRLCQTERVSAVRFSAAIADEKAEDRTTLTSSGSCFPRDCEHDVEEATSGERAEEKVEQAPPQESLVATTPGEQTLKSNPRSMPWTEETEITSGQTQSTAPSDERPQHSRSVSSHGLPTTSRTQHIVRRIPWYIKPAVPAFFNLLNSAMRWASLVFVAASVAEMLISGSELVLSVFATRCVRGRRVTCVRWLGVAVCTVGIVMVGIFDMWNAASDDDNGDAESSSMRDQTIGILLILGQSIMSVIQDLTEELFMHEAAFPPALLVGMEGSFGLAIGLILYFPIAPLLGEYPSTVKSDLSDGKIIGLSIGWALLVTVTGIFNIAATGVTSSMTRNVWKNCRTCLIWVVGLIIFYATGNPDLGEEWVIPGSFYILIGFAAMLLGVYIYYGKGARARPASSR